ncbi:fatty acid cis/trans isomerase [gamma proteobacterium NOR5-3]|nr:fatty acid cis/trans isomerase [gamma proteobacterium NOR5-3]
MSRSYWLVFLLVLGGCATVGVNLESLYGKSEPRDRVVQTLPPNTVDYWSDVKPIVDTRCIACHGCYDAPCQLKMTSIEGIERGASTAKVYNQARLRKATPTRLFEDAQTVPQWRELGFHPVLNEYAAAAANTEASVLYRMLELKRSNPLPKDKRLSKDFELGLSRKESCTTAEDFDAYAIDHPDWGMPYALPGLNEEEEQVLMSWVEQGASYTPRPPLPASYQQEAARWETFLNGNSLKERVVSRYIYEHLSYAHLYFGDLDKGRPRYFNLVRSNTPPGEPLSVIATRRPYEDPGVERPYYRLQEVVSTVVDKTHMPYVLNEQRLKRWKTLFFETDYEVTRLPSYEPEAASNPFVTFAELPVTSRYKFMLDEAKFSISTFMQGPVCRGEVAVDVIRDRFWVFFTNPDNPNEQRLAEFVQSQGENLQLPASTEAIYNPAKYWRIYQKQQSNFLASRDQFLSENFGGSGELNLSTVWDGGGNNPNAALTIFRHFDSATVKQGMIGEPPKTAWLIDYSLLERLHYLLVAGYDVFGNVGHQLNTRVYMDFLRMEGELNFLTMLPESARKAERELWYLDASKDLMAYLSSPAFESVTEPNIAYRSDNPKQELFSLLREQLTPALPETHNLAAINDLALEQELARLLEIRGQPATLLPEVANVLIQSDSAGDGADDKFVTLLSNSAYTNMTAVFGAKNNRWPDEDSLSVVPGFVGAYPNAFYRVKRADVPDFVEHIASLKSESDYSDFLDKWGVRRTQKNFWQHSDEVHAGFRRYNPVNYGALDYNRLENR